MTYLVASEKKIHFEINLTFKSNLNLEKKLLKS
jgi:hypothetical protein